ncbi:MAG: substrate-binding domain-containing protein [Chloroflexota bacterium]
MKKLNRRDFLKLGAIVSASGILASCAQKPEETEAPAVEPDVGEVPVSAEAVPAVYWYRWGNLDPALEKILETEEYKEAIKGNILEYKGAVEFEAVLTAVAAGTPPDGGSDFDYPNLWARGAALDVTDMVAASPAIKKDDIAAGLWEGSFYDGRMIGVPGIEGFNWWGMNVNAKAAEEAGLDIDNIPLTWEGLLEWHKALTKFDDSGNLLQFGLDPWDAMANEPDFAATSWGFQWWNEETKTINLNNELMAESYEVMGEFIKHVGPDKFAGMRQVEGNGTWGASYNAGVQTMIMEGYWHPGETQIQQPDLAPYNRSTWAPVPASREGAKIMATGPHFIQLFKDGKNTDGMFKFAEHMISDSALDIMFSEVGWIFGKKSWLANVDKDTYPGLAFYVDATDQVTDWIVGRRCPLHWYVTNQSAELRERVYRGEMTSVEAVAELQARALAEWDAQGLDE